MSGSVYQQRHIQDIQMEAILIHSVVIRDIQMEAILIHLAAIQAIQTGALHIQIKYVG